MKKILVLLFIFFISISSYSSCNHELCEDCQNRKEVSLRAKDGSWDGEILSFRFYVDMDKFISGINVYVNNKEYYLREFGPSILSSGNWISGTHRGSWNSAYLSLPYFSGSYSVTGSRPSYCASYRDPTVFERLQGIRKPN
tara:strand:+ start:927 stop:1349 length:423 start_codon:yes stop_codon:yes gene_type:complete